ncbi:MAG: CHRD domain-containing protein [Burkholderiales bacterium]|nr:CHRD domain-containing protein [Opitutaceae bacterium]
MKASLLRSEASRPRAARLVSLVLGVLVSTVAAHATVFTFDLQGNAGFGLLPGNENPGVTGGTGGEIGAGIFFDDVTNRITINVGWGSGNGFTDLTSNPNVAHIHSSAGTFPLDTGTAAFTRNGGVVVGLDNQPTLYTFNNSAISGFITGSSILSDALETALFAGQLYVNVHTGGGGLNPGGEIRGNLVNASAIPEPSSFAALGGAAVLGLALSRRRRRVAA